MTDIDLESLRAAAAADPRPSTSTREEIPPGCSPVDQAVAGYVMAVNLVIWDAEYDCEVSWECRQKIYIAEIARLETEGGPADPEIIDNLNLEMARADLNARYCTDMKKLAQEGYERIFELMVPLRADLRLLAAGSAALSEASTTRTEVLKRVAFGVDEINAQTQRLVEVYRPGADVQEFLAARNLDTTVPRC
ncbi:hypothetical protein [Mycobacterium riyadhense]|uniref:Uncharacterized protein n=1 Tax=Mycobacterium riyadhense TaxID=486698 RepID=A0A1X2D9E6_9MYCO|nr:hypothetical protein [Mycobacterium riyadhense]MCV7147689.1 hypothetical protein [Mycobacterium riyadhense]ORW84773.1 hypothetical protein AWC22_12805 [Mycobacterium riyadhense]